MSAGGDMLGGGVVCVVARTEVGKDCGLSEGVWSNHGAEDKGRVDIVQGCWLDRASSAKSGDKCSETVCLIFMSREEHGSQAAACESHVSGRGVAFSLFPQPTDVPARSDLPTLYLESLSLSLAHLTSHTYQTRCVERISGFAAEQIEVCIADIQPTDCVASAAACRTRNLCNKITTATRARAQRSCIPEAQK